MKIRSIELTNVRRFAGQRATLETVSDGITVLSEPNEFGKSTFFDALHALFFERHRSTRAQVKALQPHSGGAPEVQLTLDLPQGRIRLRKRWLSRATAQVFDGTGRLIAQDDEAEAWIDSLLGQGLSGPSGLLWVRQGLFGLEPEGASAAEKTERDKALSTRRDLLSSVSGEIELMTGGRRMDAVLARVAQDLARLATATLKPKADGDWRRALDEAHRLTQLRDDLAAKARRLSAELAQRAGLQRALHRLTDPEDEALRQAALRDARQAHDAAQAHAARIDALRQELKLADLTLDRAKAEIAGLNRLAAQIQTARADHATACAAAEKAEAAWTERQGESQAATLALTAAQDQARQLRDAVLAAQKAKTAAAARQRAESLTQTLAQAETQRQTMEQAQAARALLRVTEAALAEVEAAQAARDRLALRLESQSAAVSFAYLGAARALQAGQPVSEGPHHITASTLFDLPGLGQLRIDPGTASASPNADLAAAEALIQTRLRACAAADLAQARALLAEARRLDEVLRTAEAVLQGIAPQGLEALRHSLASARAEAGTEADNQAGTKADTGPQRPTPKTETETEAALAGQLAAAEAAEALSRARAEEARARDVAAGERRAAAQADRISTARALAAAVDEAGEDAALAARLAALTEGLVPLGARRQALDQDLAGLIAAAPDLTTAAARLTRAESAETQARQQRAQLQTDLAMLNGSIGALADQGIEEALDDVAGLLASAEARAARYEAEVQALDRLRRALETARKAARDAYFGPVLRELTPLLGILHPGARLQIDDHSLLPSALTRDGLDERLEILSGGTREQLAILTRLAFARLFAQSGRAVPIILDDALVHSDDDRIEAMFTALHRIARDQQILILTCRHRAFASLGGERARVRVEPA